MFNQITLIGNLGEDAKVQAEGKLLRLRVATSSRYKKGQEWVESVEWHTVKYWTDSAKDRAERLKKGSQVLIQGSISSEEYQGQKQVYVKAYKVNSLSPKPQPQPSPGGWG